MTAVGPAHAPGRARDLEEPDAFAQRPLAAQVHEFQDSRGDEAARTTSQEWIDECVARERTAFLLTGGVSVVLFPLWGAFDGILEPELLRPFLCLRAIDFVVGGWLLFELFRARDILRIRLFGGLRNLLSGAIVAFMCASVSARHYFPYVLGFSIMFWAIGIFYSWPLRHSVALYAALFAAYVVARCVVTANRPVVEEVGALFYLGSAALLSVMSVENRRRLHYKTFLANHQLALRNGELDATLRSLRETQTRLVEGEKLSALGRLIASLSHEINNPVNVLRHNIEPLRDYLQKMNDVLKLARAGEDLEAAWEKNELDFVLGDATDALGTMDRGISRIQTVYNDMRAFVRGDSPEVQAGDLNDGLKATVNMFRRSLPQTIAIEMHCAQLPPTSFQPGQMNQVFFNLVQNAVDAIEGTGKPGTIAIRSEPEAGWVRVTVEDTGPGVSAWAREHLFEPFFTTKGAGKGTGLGLAISHQIIHRHRGTIELDDAHLGARFVVRIPAGVTPSNVEGNGRR